MSHCGAISGQTVWIENLYMRGYVKNTNGAKKYKGREYVLKNMYYAINGIKQYYNCCLGPVFSPIHLFDVAQLKGASLKSSLYGITGNGHHWEGHGRGRLDETVLSV